MRCREKEELVESLSRNHQLTIIHAMSANETKQDLLRHFLAALAYRTRKALAGAPKDFAHFEAGHEVRKPLEIISHMSGVLLHAHSFVVGGEAVAFSAGGWEEEVRRLFSILSNLDRSLELRSELNGRDREQLLQGPLSDAMTHVGQLAMLRRMASSPLSKESFDVAPILIGDFSLPSDV
jgi:hypothetical protein